MGRRSYFPRLRQHVSERHRLWSRRCYGGELRYDLVLAGSHSKADSLKGSFKISRTNYSSVKLPSSSKAKDPHYGAPYLNFT